MVKYKIGIMKQHNFDCDVHEDEDNIQIDFPKEANKILGNNKKLSVIAFNDKKMLVMLK